MFWIKLGYIFEVFMIIICGILLLVVFSLINSMYKEEENKTYKHVPIEDSIKNTKQRINKMNRKCKK